MTCPHLVSIPRPVFPIAAALVLSFCGSSFGAAPPASYDGLTPDQFMKNWLVLGPVPISTEKSPDEATQKKAFADDLLSTAGGEAGVQPEAGRKVVVAGKTYDWGALSSTTDIIDLKQTATPEDHSVAYAWADIEMREPTKGLLGIGSDDGVKVWLNGALIHENWIGRPSRTDDDIVPVDFKKGRNRLLLKIQNMEGPWGFVCRSLGPETQARKLIAAAAGGNLDEVKRLLDFGIDVNRRGAAGITAVQAAKVRGQTEMVAFLVSKGADAGAPIPTPDQLVNALFTTLIKPDSPGVAVLVARDGKVLLEKAYGLASVEHRVPVTPETKFRIGSISKQFTAAAILKLAEEGKLGVQDKLSKFIPDYPRGDEVTIHHLLTHTSGIHSFTSKPEFIQNVTVGANAEDHIKSFKNDPYDFDPGKRWLYNNSGYFLLGYIIEKVSGDWYGNYLRKTFFEPLGMHHTGVHEITAVLDHEATGYSFDGARLKKSLNWDMSKAGGAGALYSTVGDLYRWNEAVFNGKVLTEGSLKAAFTPVRTVEQDASQPVNDGYGYGWAVRRFRGTEEISHGGGLNGFVSYLLRLPQKEFTVVVLVNAAPPAPGVNPGELAHEVAEVYLASELAPRETPKVDATVAAKSLDAIAGRYDYGGAILTVTREGGKVFAQLTGQPKFEIFPKSESNFFWKVVEAEVSFLKNDQGEVTKAIHRQGGQTINAPRLADVTEAKVDPKVLDAYVGRYDYGGGKSILTVTRDGDHLWAQMTGQPKFEIFPKSETEFVWKVVNAQVTFVKDGSGKVTKAVHEQGGQKFDAPRME